MYMNVDVPAEVHYPVPDHRQPALVDGFRDVLLPVSERLAREVLTLPCFPEMTDDEVGSVIASCNAWRHPSEGSRRGDA